MSSRSVEPGRPIFDAAEFSLRVDRLRERMRAADVAVSLFDEIESLTWLSGYGNSENRWRCVVVPRDSEPFFLIRALDAGACRHQTWINDVLVFSDWEDPMPILAAALALRGLATAKIGLDFGSYGMSVERFNRLSELLPEASLVNLGNVVWELRVVKSTLEIDLLRRAAAVADRAMLRTVAACLRGSSHRDAAAAASAAFIELGAEAGSPGPISSGQGWDFLHRPSSDAPLAVGDVVHIELTPRVSGYGARLMRCVVIGEPSLELQNASASLCEMQDKQIDAMRPGAVAADVDAILRRGVLENGLRSSFDNISGYTLGLYASAGPRTSDFTRCFHPQAHWQLESGMVFHMYASAQGVSYSETVLVTESGHERLTKSPRNLFINPGIRP